MCFYNQNYRRCANLMRLQLLIIMLGWEVKFGLKLVAKTALRISGFTMSLG